MKVLFVTFYFFKREEIPTNRVLGITQFLSDFGWEVSLLTLNPQKIGKQYNTLPNKSTKNSAFYNSERCRSLIQEVLSADISEKDNTMINVNNKRYICRIREFLANLFYNKIYSSVFGIKLKKLWAIFSKISYMFTMRFWEIGVSKLLRSELKSSNYDTIMDTFGPPSSHIVCSNAVKEITIPWVADYRDLWSIDNDFKTSHKFWKRYQAFEKKIMTNACCLTTVSQPLASSLASFHQKKVAVIPNGFDPNRTNPGIELRPKFTITYTGTVYSGTQNPEPLFIALRYLIDENLIDPNDIDIRFYGPKSPKISEMIKQYELGMIIQEGGLIPKDQAIVMQWTSQILLHLVWEGPISEGVLSGKLFEYLGAKRPILAIGSKDTGVKNILSKTNSGIQARTYSDVKDYILMSYHEYKQFGRVSYHGIDEEVNKYSHKEMAKKFANVLYSVQKDSCNYHP